ncbi:hypothetical protein CVIRNUC_003841 [Coccomyxa viridis]|uniref:Uncharacterized protein n=1 Tax=Coccomyxa viridis TaxID=1274662 RepID=A0AAV1I199_9CHLO|nr:hypothetical protein CVIRNUC_003841 [Coccomyxa viridis]
MWSCIIGAVGIAIPVVVPPIRESFSKGRKINPPPVSQLIKGATSKSSQEVQAAP